MTSAKEASRELVDHGQIKYLSLPDGWVEAPPEPYTGIGGRSFRHFHPADNPRVKLCFFYRGLPASKTTGEAFAAVIASPPHALSPEEIDAIKEVLRDRHNPKDFTMKLIRTQALSGRNVLALQGVYNEINEETLAMCIDADGTGRLIQEVYFQAPAADFQNYVSNARSAFKSIEWIKRDLEPDLFRDVIDEIDG